MCFPLKSAGLKKKKSYFLSYHPKIAGIRFQVFVQIHHWVVPSSIVTRPGTRSFKEPNRVTGKLLAHAGLRNAVQNILRKGQEHPAFHVARAWKEAQRTSERETCWTGCPRLFHSPRLPTGPTRQTKAGRGLNMASAPAQGYYRAPVHTRRTWPVWAKRSCRICKGSKVPDSFPICPTILLILFIYQDRVNVITHHFYSRCMINSEDTVKYYFTKGSVK